MLTTNEALATAAHYGYGNNHEGSASMRYFARTGKIAPGLRAYLTGSCADPSMMPPRLATLAQYVRNH